MKRALLKNVTAMPYESGQAVDRTRHLSAVLGVQVETGGTVSVVVSHCDTKDGAFEPVVDPMIYLGERYEGAAVETDDLVNIDIDLLACKRYVSFAVTGTAGTSCALVLGDTSVQPSSIKTE